MVPCVDSCVKSGALSPSRSDGDGRTSTGTGRLSFAAPVNNSASNSLAFSAPYSCCDSIAAILQLISLGIRQRHGRGVAEVGVRPGWELGPEPTVAVGPRVAAYARCVGAAV